MKMKPNNPHYSFYFSNLGHYLLERDDPTKQEKSMNRSLDNEAAHAGPAKWNLKSP